MDDGAVLQDQLACRASAVVIVAIVRLRDGSHPISFTLFSFPPSLLDSLFVSTVILPALGWRPLVQIYSKITIGTKLVRSYWNKNVFYVH